MTDDSQSLRSEVVRALVADYLGRELNPNDLNRLDYNREHILSVAYCRLHKERWITCYGSPTAGDDNHRAMYFLLALHLLKNFEEIE